jgi:hypothetical protein
MAKAPSCILCGVSLGYDIYPDIGLLFIRGQGWISQPERIHAMLASFRDPGYERCTDALIDVAKAQSTPRVRELRQLMAILQRQRPTRGPTRVAVVTSKPITFAIARVFQHLAHLRRLQFDVRVFMDLRQAWDWLRPGEPPFQLH